MILLFNKKVPYATVSVWDDHYRGTTQFPVIKQALNALNVRKRLPLLSVQGSGFGGKFTPYPNTRKLPADGSLSLGGNTALLCTFTAFVKIFFYLKQFQKYCQALTVFTEIR